MLFNFAPGLTFYSLTGEKASFASPEGCFTHLRGGALFTFQHHTTLHRLNDTKVFWTFGIIVLLYCWDVEQKSG